MARCNWMWVGAAALLVAGCNSSPPTEHCAVKLLEADPPFGIIEVKDPWTVRVTASDPCEEEPLYARLYWRNGAQRLPLDSRTLTPSSADPSERSGEFIRNSWCQLMGGPGEKIVDVFVMNRPFPTTGALPEPNDWKFWVAKCQ